MNKQTTHFPDDFLWGASTAAHQVEGGNHNQWTVWEHQQAQHLADTAQTKLGQLTSWPRIQAQATDPANYISGKGVEHYTRYKEDFGLLQTLHMNAFRFGIEWSRLEPQPGQWNAQAIQHYQDYIAELKRRGIEPILTLWHWTMPTWFTDMGGFTKRKNLHYFYRYVAKIAELYGDDITYVLTLNEPTVYAGLSYGAGEWPPQHKNPLEMVQVLRNLARAHNQAYTILKAACPHMQVGLAAQLANIKPLKASWSNRAVVHCADYAANWWFMDKVRHHQDFMGLNYYFTEYRDWRYCLRNPKGPSSDLGWYMEPAGIQRLLQAVWHRYQKPIIITENGLADAADEHRQWWLAETLQALNAARLSGVDLRGYLYWSLLDNFEWAYGWWPEFGLVHVDRKTMQRTIRPSARWFADYISANKSSS